MSATSEVSWIPSLVPRTPSVCVMQSHHEARQVVSTHPRPSPVQAYPGRLSTSRQPRHLPRLTNAYLGECSQWASSASLLPTTHRTAPTHQYLHVKATVADLCLTLPTLPCPTPLPCLTRHKCHMPCRVRVTLHPRVCTLSTRPVHLPLQQHQAPQRASLAS